MIEFSGTFYGMTIDYKSRKPLISFLINEDPGDLQTVLSFPLKLKLSRMVDKHRTNNANKYYWELLSQLSEVLSREGTYYSTARLHNENLRDMWNMLLKRVDGSFDLSLIKDTDAAEKAVLEDINTHRMPVPVDIFPGFNPIENKNGVRWRWYLGLRGSSEMNTVEFSKLLDITIEKCQLQGIPTDTPEEVARIKSLWKEKNEK